ncbi:hypothetical protein Efla_005111 [Eimeria flavescens]
MHLGAAGVLSEGPFAVVTDVHSGTVCSLEETLQGEPPIPAECECSFHRLKQRQERCAAFSLASAHEAEECTKDFCELCCILKVARMRKKKNTEARICICVQVSVRSPSASPGEDRTQLVSFIEYTEVFFRRLPAVADLNIKESLAAPAASKAEQQTPRAAPAAAAAAAGAAPAAHAPDHRPQPAAAAPAAAAGPVRASYPLVRLPSEEELAAAVAGGQSGRQL